MDVLYEDEMILVVDKPPGLFVHRTPLSPESKINAQLMLRDQVGYYVYPVHRLDRKTQGLLMFAKSKEALVDFQKLFMNNAIQKTYTALVRGFMEDIAVEKPLVDEKGKVFEAYTDFKVISHLVLPIGYDKFPETRLSLVNAFPKTGRTHQIRRHLAHQRNYLIGDKVHGNNKVNKVCRDFFQEDMMYLYANKLVFYHPILNKKVYVERTFDFSFLNPYIVS